MNKISLTNDEFYPPISKEDYNFVLKINKKYDITISELSSLVREIRWNVDLYKIKSLSKVTLDRLQKIVFPNDAVIQMINISTNKGSITLRKSDIFFEYFSSIFLRTKDTVKTLYNADDKKGRLADDYFILFSIAYNIFNTSLIIFQKRVVIGKFIAHFHIGKKVKTEDEFYPNKQEVQDYDHYLNDIVKSRLKKYKKEFPNLF